MESCCWKISRASSEILARFFQWYVEKIMSKCEECHCNCHCNDPLHAHHYDGDLCICDDCKCKSKSEDKSYENEKLW